MFKWFRTLESEIRKRLTARAAAVTNLADQMVAEAGSNHLAYQAAREIARELGLRQRPGDREAARKWRLYSRACDELRLRSRGPMAGADTATRMLYR